jgi:hypothetical protein
MAYEKNEWLQLNKKKIDQLQYVLTEMAYKNENPGVPIAEFRGIIGAAVVEIKKLQEQVDTLSLLVKQANEQDKPQPDKNE